MADAPVATFSRRRWLFRAAWILLAASLAWPLSWKGGHDPDLSAVHVYQRASAWSDAAPGSALDPGLFADAMLGLAVFTHVLFLYSLYIRRDARLGVAWKVLAVGCLSVDTGLALAVPELARLTAYWIWLASIACLALGYLAPGLPAGAAAGAGVRTRSRSAAAIDRGEVPPLVWVLLGFTAFWIVVAAIDHAGPDASEAALAQPLTEYVNDRARLLTPDEDQRLSLALQKFAAATPSQIAVAIYPHAPAGAIEEFTIRAVERLPLGRAGLDNGVLLFVFIDARTARLEVGYGLEGTLTDAAAHRILETRLAPAFARNAWFEGVDSTLRAVMSTVQEADQHDRLPGPITLAGRKVTSGGARLPQRIWRAIADSDIVVRIGVTLFCAFIGLFLAGTAAQWGRLAKDVGRGAGNLIARRQVADGMEAVDVTTLADSVRLFLWAVGILLPSAGVILLAAGGAFGGAGALVHW